MKRLLTSCGFALALLALSTGAANAEVKTRNKSQVKFEGMLGRMVGMFGGKAAKEGVVSTSAVKGNRKATVTDTTGLIVDLSEEKVYNVDYARKTYEVVTFAEMRQQLKDAQEKAAKEAREQQGKEKDKDEKAAGKEPEVEIDFDMKETGQKRTIVGYDAREVVMTITVREKGKTLEQGGGLVLSSSQWLGPDIPAMKELAEFELKYWKAIAPEPEGVSAEQMAAVMAMYPLLKQGMERLNKEKVNLQGTPLASTTTFDAVKSAEQMDQDQKQSSGGGLSGMLARKMIKKGDEKPRATIFTITGETLEIATSVPPADLEIPAGFKQKK